MRDDHRVLDVDAVVGRPIAVRTGGRADGREPDRDHPVRPHELEQLRLLEMGVELHLVGDGPDPRIAEHEPQLRDRHVRGADVADEPAVDELLELAAQVAMYLLVDDTAGRANRGSRRRRPGWCVFGNGQWTRYRSRYVEAQIAQRALEGRRDARRGVVVIPQLRRDPQLVAPTRRRRSRAPSDSPIRCSLP